MSLKLNCSREKIIHTHTLTYRNRDEDNEEIIAEEQSHTHDGRVIKIKMKYIYFW